MIRAACVLRLLRARTRFESMTDSLDRVLNKQSSETQTPGAFLNNGAKINIGGSDIGDSDSP